MGAIPKQYKQFCKIEDVRDCVYIMHRDCPGTCGYARGIAGVGAVVQLPKSLEKKVQKK